MNQLTREFATQMRVSYNRLACRWNLQQTFERYNERRSLISVGRHQQNPQNCHNLDKRAFQYPLSDSRSIPIQHRDRNGSFSNQYPLFLAIAAKIHCRFARKTRIWTKIELWTDIFKQMQPIGSSRTITIRCSRSILVFSMPQPLLVTRGAPKITTIHGNLSFWTGFGKLSRGFRRQNMPQ